MHMHTNINAHLIFYFFPKAFLLLRGCDLNAQFQIVKKATQDKGVGRISNTKINAAYESDRSEGSNVNLYLHIFVYFMHMVVYLYMKLYICTQFQGLLIPSYQNIVQKCLKVLKILIELWSITVFIR